MLGSILGSGNVALSIGLAHVKALEQFFQMFQLTYQCVVPENIHTPPPPPRKVTGNSEGEGGL